MTRLRFLGALTMLGAFLIAGCDDEAQPSQGALDLASFATRYAETMCSAVVTCSCADPSALGDCRTAYREYVLYGFARDLTGSPGRKLDPAAAQTCLADLAAAVSGCSSTADIRPESCWGERLLVGTQTEGESCASWRDCATGLDCDPRTSACAPRAALDASCTFLRCEDGLYCAPGELCAAIPGEGEACPTWECQGGLSCVDVSGEMTCVAPHALEDDCSDGAGCVAGTFCDDGTWTCTARLADGESCDWSGQCLSGWCNVEGTCTDPGFCGAFWQKR
jgi:hypothetical protein